MKVIWGLEEARFHPSTVTTLGSYDGVHLGHRAIIAALESQKQKYRFDRSVVVTFHPHPQAVLRRNNTTVKLLTTIEERLTLLSQTGIDEAIVIEFTPEFSHTSYIDFFQETLVGKLGTRMMVVGHNHAFGKNREGDADNLKRIAAQLDVKVQEVPPLTINDVSISSTKIRHAIEQGEVALANAMLGRKYSFKGNVVHGDKIGRELGYPTANLEVQAGKLIPADGVYACKVHHLGRMYIAALSIGHRPTIGEGLQRAVELFLLDFNGDLYGETLEVYCVGYLRGQKLFDSLDDLKHQIQLDVTQCTTILKNESIFA